MFGKLRDKIKSWISGSAKKIEKEKEELVGTEPILEDSDKIIEDAKEKTSKPIPTKFEVGKQKFEPDLEKIKEEIEEKIDEIPQKTPKSVKQALEQNKKTQELAVDIEKDLEKADRLIEKSKKKSYPEPPSKFSLTKRKLEPDTEKIKEEAEKLIKELKEAKKIEREKKEIEKNILRKGLDQATSEKKSFFSRIASTFKYKISENEFEEIFDDLELLLLENNVALDVVKDIRSNLAEKLIGREIRKQDLELTISIELKNSLKELIIEPDNPLDIIKKSKKPFVILFFGTNGVGKTTSIAKIANFLKKASHSVVLAAGDTFRAASIEQLSEHGKKLGITVIKHNYGSDPAAVGYDAIKYAKNHKIDVVLIDTAGRMHTKSNLIEEMKKIERVTEPDLKIFVAESIAGNDAIEQAKTFHEAIEIDGSILSKADIDEKGGTIISISHTTNRPIFYLGTGQNYDDLELFNKQKFIESLGL